MYEQYEKLINSLNNRILRISFLIFVLITLALAIVLTAIALGAQSYTLDSLKKNELTAVNYQTDIIKHAITEISEDVLLISQNDALKRYLATGNEIYADEFASDLVTISKIRTNYDQLRYVDEKGMERIRVNYQFGEPYIVAKNSLQNKDSRYYFNNTMNKSGKTIYISPIDLNIENGILEIPMKPMIRFGIKLYSDNKEKGIFIANYTAGDLLNRLKKTVNSINGEINILNNNGYWLLSSKDGNEWGFMLDDRASRKFQNDFPEEWDAITYKGSGQTQTKNGIFTFNTVYLFENGSVSENVLNNEKNVEVWRLIQRIPPDKIKKYQNEQNTVIIYILAAALLLSFIPAWIAAEYSGRKKLGRTAKHLVKNYDPVTRMPSRVLFFKDLSDKVNFVSKSHEALGLLLFELTNLNELLQKCGTEATEHVLVNVAEVLDSSTDKNVSAYSIGNGRFAMIAGGSMTRQELDKLKQSALLKLHEIKPENINSFTIKFAVGSCLYPEDAYEHFAIYSFAEQSLQKSAK